MVIWTQQICWHLFLFLLSLYVMLAGIGSIAVQARIVMSYLLKWKLMPFLPLESRVRVSVIVQTQRDFLLGNLLAAFTEIHKCFLHKKF